MALAPDRRFRLVNAYAEAHGYFAGFPNFHEADYGNGVVGGVHLLQDTVAEWRDVPRVTYGVYHIEDVPGLFRGANDYAATEGYPAAFPNCNQADHGQGVVYGTILLKDGSVEWRDVPRATLGNPGIDDVRAMMTAAANYAWANGFVAGFPTFHQANYGAGVVYGIVLFPPGNAEWRDVAIEDLYFQEPKDERTCVVLCRFRNDDGTLTPTEATRDFYEEFFLTRGTGGLADFYRDVTHGRLNLVGDVFDWLDIGHTVTEHRSMMGQPQRFQAFNWAMQAARAQGLPVDTYPRQVVVVNQDTDWGGINRGQSMLLPHSPGSPWSHARAAHEFGHVLGLWDAFNTTQGASGTVDGPYQDAYCIMSYATRGDRYQSTVSGVTSETGPGLGGLYAHRLEGIPPSRIYTVPAAGAADTVLLAPLTHADEEGALLVQVPPTPARPNTYWVELRHRSNWDRAIAKGEHVVVLHESRPGDERSYVVDIAGRQDVASLQEEALTTPDGSIGVRLAHVDPMTVEVRVWELGPTKLHEIRISQLVWNPPGDEVAGERVVLRSDRLQPVSLAGWTLRDEKDHPASSPWTFVFPDVELAPGEDLLLWTKAGHADAHNLYWGLGHAVWNNTGGDTAILSDAAGNEVTRFSY
ncbi:MAG TPA: lamin tail domain-containing protein [Gaiella sp.]|jgi:hypothetical protein